MKGGKLVRRFKGRPHPKKKKGNEEFLFGLCPGENDDGPLCVRATRKKKKKIQQQTKQQERKKKRNTFFFIRGSSVEMLTHTKSRRGVVTYAAVSELSRR